MEKRSEKKRGERAAVSNRMAQMCVANSSQSTEELLYLQFYVKSIEQNEQLQTDISEVLKCTPGKIAELLKHVLIKWNSLD